VAELPFQRIGRLVGASRVEDSEMRSPIAALPITLLAVFAVAGPAAAYTAPVSAYGNTVECRYKAGGNGPAYEFKLRRLTVTPPEVYSKTAHQTVGWRFVVTRSIYYEGEGPWRVTYRSPIQRAPATTTHAAAFTAQTVQVELPVEPRRATYHVTLKLYWYRSDGTVHSTTTYLMPWMKWYQNGRYYYGDYDDVCPGGFYVGP
jgi:hypothetical protein